MGKAIKYVPLYLVVFTIIMIGINVLYRKVIAAPLVTAKAVPVNIAVKELEVQPYDEVLELPGRLMAERSVMLASELAARIDEWRVAEGQTVEKGEVLVALNRDALEARLLELRAQEQRAKAARQLSDSSVEMAEINVRSAADDLKAAESRLKVAESDEAIARDELKRTKALYERNVASKVEFDGRTTEFSRASLELSNAKNAFSQAENSLKLRNVDLDRAKIGIAQADAGLKEVEAGLASVKVAIDKTLIKAPFSGVVDEHLKEIGDIVQSGEPLGWLFDYSAIRIRVNVSDRYAPFLEMNKPVLTRYLKTSFPGAVQNLKGILVVPGLPTLNGGRSEGVELPATIAYLGKAGSVTSNTFPVELKAVNPGGVFKQGLLGRARITVLTYENALMIPLKAMRVTENGPQCFIAVKQGEGFVARAQAVEPRSIQDNQVMVSGNLKAGDKLILTGVQELLDGQSVAIIETRKAPAEAESTGN